MGGDGSLEGCIFSVLGSLINRIASDRMVTRQPPRVVNMYPSKELERQMTGEGYQNEHWGYVVTMSIAAEPGDDN